MDETYAILAIRYIELNPVRAGLVSRPEDYPWSSARSHVQHQPDSLLQPCSLLTDRVADWGKFLAEGIEEIDGKRLQNHEHTGRPLGNQDFLVHLEKKLKRSLQKHRPGPKTSPN